MIEKVPRVSIGLPVYNGEEYLAEAIESHLAQTFTDFELIISDNASTDGTQGICESFVARDPRVRYERAAQNCGASANFNRAFELARGEYFKWAAHDDICAADFLARSVAVLDSEPDVAWCFSRSQIIDKRGQPVPTPTRSMLDASSKRHPAIASRDASRPQDRFLGVLLGLNWCLDLYGLTRTAVLRKTRLMRPVYGIEKVLIAELSLLGRYEEIDEPLMQVRVHANASGALASLAEQQAFYNPQGVRRFDFPRLRLLWGYVTATVRAPLSISERLGCALAVGRYIMQVRKWKRVLTSTYRRKGTGAGNSEIDLYTPGKPGGTSTNGEKSTRSTKKFRNDDSPIVSAN
jgi:hypothetical protein